MESDFILTRISVIYENLYIAANDPLCTHPILEKVFSAIEENLWMDGLLRRSDEDEANGQSGDDSSEDFDIFTVCLALDKNRLSERDRILLRARFEKLLEGSMAI